MSKITEHLKQLITILSNPDQKDYYKFILKSGREYRNSILHTPKIRIHIEGKMCYSNALKMALYDNLGYVEGFYMTEKLELPLEHAFNEIKGKYFDSTTRKSKVKVTERFGVRVPKRVLMKYLLEDDRMQSRFTALKYYYLTMKNKKL